MYASISGGLDLRDEDTVLAMLLVHIMIIIFSCLTSHMQGSGFLSDCSQWFITQTYGDETALGC